MKRGDKLKVRWFGTDAIVYVEILDVRYDGKTVLFTRLDQEGSLYYTSRKMLEEIVVN